MDALFPTPQPPHFSFWEIERHLSGIDLLIVGGGIVGLTTAIFCKQMRPRLSVTVMERGSLPSGASTKNAGFACFGSLSELLADLRTQSSEEVFQRAADRLQGLKELRVLLGDDAIVYDACGGYELFTPHQSELYEQCMALLPEANRLMAPHTGLEMTFTPSDRSVSRFGLQKVEHLITNHAEGAIDTGRMMEALTEKALTLGIRKLTGMGVRSVSDCGDHVAVALENGHELRAGMLHVATNGFARQLMPQLDVRPARAQVLITSPVADLRVKGTFHLDEGYYYFRNVGDRVLIGGGRNLDPVGETTVETGLTERIQSKLEELLEETVLPGTSFQVAHRWSGVMGIGSTKDTIVRHLSDRVTCAVRMGGMGVALGTLIGKRSAALILGGQPKNP